MSTNLTRHLSEERGAKLREAVSRLNMQVSDAEADAKAANELLREMSAVMEHGPENARIPAAMEMAFLRESRDRSNGKIDKLSREREEAKLRLELYNALRRSCRE